MSDDGCVRSITSRLPLPPLLVVLLLALSGCASGGGESEPALASALEQLDTETEYAATERCLSTYRYDSVEILDDSHLLFESATGQDLWLNQLRTRCPGLRRNDTLAFDLRGSQVCNLDTVTVIDHFLFWRRSGPTCSLGQFHELTEPQAELLRQALRAD